MKFLKWVATMASTIVLVACGGGGDDAAGSITEFSIVPSSITVTGPPGECAAGTVGEVFIYGGHAPYRLDNTVPAYISLNKTRVDHKGESFSVTFLGGCLDPGQVVVVDHLDKQVTLTLVNEPGE